MVVVVNDYTLDTIVLSRCISGHTCNTYGYGDTYPFKPSLQSYYVYHVATLAITVHLELVSNLNWIYIVFDIAVIKTYAALMSKRNCLNMDALTRHTVGKTIRELRFGPRPRGPVSRRQQQSVGARSGQPCGYLSTIHD